MVPTQKLNFLRLIFGTFQPQSKSRARKKTKKQTLRDLLKVISENTGKTTIFQWEKKVGKESHQWEKMVGKGPEEPGLSQDRGPRVICGQCSPRSPSGIFVFPKGIGVIPDIPP